MTLHRFQIKELSLENIRINPNGVLFKFILSKYFDQLEELVLENCQITNEIVEQIAIKISQRTKPVSLSSILNNCTAVYLQDILSIVY